MEAPPAGTTEEGLGQSELVQNPGKKKCKSQTQINHQFVHSLNKKCNGLLVQVHHQMQNCDCKET